MADSKSGIGKAFYETKDGEMRPLKFREPTVEDMVLKLSFGVAVDLGQKCPECPEFHYCDMICFRFSPWVFLCAGCGQYHRHRKMDELLRSYHMNKLLEDGGA